MIKKAIHFFFTFNKWLVCSCIPVGNEKLRIVVNAGWAKCRGLAHWKNFKGVIKIRSKKSLDTKLGLFLRAELVSSCSTVSAAVKLMKVKFRGEMTLRGEDEKSWNFPSISLKLVSP